METALLKVFFILTNGSVQYIEQSLFVLAKRERIQNGGHDISRLMDNLSKSS